RPVDNLISSVAVYIADRQRVGALTDVVPVNVAVDVPSGSEMPLERQLAVPKVVGRNLVARLAARRLRPVITPSHDEAWPHPVEVGDAGRESVDPISVVVPPLRHGAAGRFIRNRGKLP